MRTEPVTLLLVEDDEADRELIQRCFRRHKIANKILFASNGEEGLRVLREGITGAHMVLLDLNMPRMNGLEFLEELRSDDSISDTVVFVFTTSDQERDKLAAYKKNVAGYILKQCAGVDFRKMTSLLDSYWKVVQLPVKC